MYNMRQSSLTKMAAFVFITMNTLACFNNNNKSRQTASSTTLPPQTIIRYAINLGDEYLDRKEGNKYFYKVPPGTEAIITATLGGAKEDVEVGWRQHITGLRGGGLPQQEARTWKYKAKGPAKIEVHGAPSSQMTINDMDKFVNEQKVFVIGWVCPLKIEGVDKDNRELTYFKKEGTMSFHFTVSLQNTSKDSIALEDLTFRFKLFFKQDYEMEPIVFKHKDISISKDTLATGEMLEIEVEKDLCIKIKATKVILNAKELGEWKFRQKLVNLLKEIQFEVLDQEGNVIGA